ncbi:transmembrane protein 132D-like, partial [Cynoglossus semilaevis]|uniref:transmembrane protein 132D-like n=1 Tax=Cynoglossus semilaevis TaxID=244447 RepID=UPI000D62FA01
RSTRDSEGEDDEAERRGRGCTLQYQQTVVKVLTAFVADEDDPPGQTVFMLSSDWQVDVTAMVWDFLKVEDPRVARLLDAGTLVGLDPGRTSIQ